MMLLNEKRLALVEDRLSKAHIGIHNGLLDLAEMESVGEWLDYFVRLKSAIAKTNYEIVGAMFGLMDDEAQAFQVKAPKIAEDPSAHSAPEEVPAEEVPETNIEVVTH